jgi:hypothetical protein
MICTVCNKKITEGQYKYRSTSSAHLPMHRACSKDDPKWAEIDKQKQAQVDLLCLQIKEYRALRDKWNDNSLDESIDDMVDRAEQIVKYHRPYVKFS